MKGSQERNALDYISGLIYDRCRIRLDDGKHGLIRARLGKRVRHYGFAGLPEYCRFLQTRADEEEFTRVVDALTTNFTHFMREADHFEFLTGTALPEALARGDKFFRLWSAACSSGEEPYTASFFLAEQKAQALKTWNWAVTASDISTKVLEKARSGIYEEERVASLPREWLPRYFQKGVGDWSGFYRVKRSVVEKIEFRQLNLVEGYSHVRPYHVIFCRNVMIYFDRATQEQLVKRLCHFLIPNGYLIIGHSESLNGLQVPVRCLRPSIYQRN